MKQFLEIEYRKRHFEYYDKDNALWLKNHWDEYIQDIEDEKYRIILITYVIKMLPLIGLEGSIEVDKKTFLFKLISYLFVKDKNWLKRIVNISLKYGIAAPYLIKPFDMKTLLYLKNKIDFFPFLLGVMNRIDNEEDRVTVINSIFDREKFAPWTFFSYKNDTINIEINLNHSDYNYEQTMQAIDEVMSIFSLNNANNLDDLIRSTRGLEKKIEKKTSTLFTGTMKKSYDTRLLGLLLWDLKISDRWDERLAIFDELELKQIFKSKGSNMKSSYETACACIKAGKCISVKNDYTPDIIQPATVYFKRECISMFTEEPTFSLRKNEEKTSEI